MLNLIFTGFVMLFSASLFADDPLLTEEFFESPATEKNEEDGKFERDIDAFLGNTPSEPQEEVEVPSGPLFERHSFSAGIGISQGAFSLTGGLRSHFNSYLVLENSLYYIKEFGELSGKTYSLEFYGPETSLMAEYQVVKLITVIAGAGVGYELWSQLYDEYEFDKSNSLTAVFQVGGNINMTANFVLQLRHFTRVYLMDQPIELEDRLTKKNQAVSQFQVNFLFRF
ncbi:hypothetical protein N9D31_02295 [Oligoflexaceae bacterium]|nr:hypothetical protein [Oligoflexaceae bacterium]